MLDEAKLSRILEGEEMEDDQSGEDSGSQDEPMVENRPNPTQPEAIASTSRCAPNPQQPKVEDVLTDLQAALKEVEQLQEPLELDKILKFLSTFVSEVKKMKSAARGRRKPLPRKNTKMKPTATKSMKPSQKINKVTNEMAQQQLWEGINKDNSLLIKRAVNKYGADLEQPRSDGWTPLTEAAKKGKVGVIRTLIRLEENLDLERKGAGQTALWWASMEGHNDVVRVLLKNKVNVEAEDVYRATPLHRASEKGHLKIVEMLLKDGALISARDSYNATPLHYACTEGHIDIVRLLVSKGANLEAQDYEQYRPLHMASEKGHEKVVKLLVEKGADINARTRAGHTALYLAKMRRCYEVVNYLCKS